MNMPTHATDFDQRTLRDVMGRFVTGVTVVTTCDADNALHGLTVNAFSSVSLDPPLVLWCQAITARSFAAFRDGAWFAVNILAHDQAWVSKHFATPHPDKFSSVDHVRGQSGVPLLAGVVASLECSKVATHLCGDHVVHIGRIARLSQSEREPLVFARGRYVVAAPSESLGALAVESAC